MPGTSRALLAAVAVAALAAGCGGTPQPPARPGGATSAPAVSPPATPASATGPAVRLTARQACRLLRADLARHQGVPDIPTLRRVADHVDAAPRLAADARTAVRDIDHTGAAALAVVLLRDQCARAGVPIPAP